MKKILLSLTVFLMMCCTVYAQKKERQTANELSSKTLVAYFSATGTTAKVARSIANITGGELFAIEPKSPYTRADLDWHDKQSRSSVEMNDIKSRPALKGLKANMADYDVVFLGYPIWWNCAPRIINTFIESHNLKGKVIVPFATSGSSSISNSVTELKKAYPDLDWQTGKLLNRVNNNDLQNWVKSVVR